MGGLDTFRRWIFSPATNCPGWVRRVRIVVNWILVDFGPRLFAYASEEGEGSFFFAPANQKMRKFVMVRVLASIILEPRVSTNQ